MRRVNHLRLQDKAALFAILLIMTMVGVAEVARADIWSPAASMSTARGTHTATLLSDGLVLVAGGSNDGITAVAGVETYNPLTNSWSAMPNMKGVDNNSAPSTTRVNVTR